MKVRRWALSGTALVATLGLAVGCGGSGGASGASGTAPSTGAKAAILADPKQAVSESVKGIANGNYNFAVTDYNATGSGSMDAPSKNAHLKVTEADDEGLELIAVGNDRWIKLATGSGRSDTWLHVEVSKISNAKALREISINFDDVSKRDPLGAPVILKALVTAQQTSDGSYSGTVDLTKARDADSVDSTIVDALGDKAKDVPFTASIDDQGRLTLLTLDMPAAGEVQAHKLELSYSGYGEATSVQRPPANQTQEAPAQFYDSING